MNRQKQVQTNKPYPKESKSIGYEPTFFYKYLCGLRILQSQFKLKHLRSKDLIFHAVLFNLMGPTCL